VQTTRTELESVRGELDSTESELESVRNELGSTESELESVRNELGSTESELESVKDDLTASQSEVSELTSSLGKSKTELDGVRDELNEIKEVYPARHFSSMKELEDWLLANDVSDRPASTAAENSYGKALDIQEAALKDGYIISAYIDYFTEEEIFLVLLEAVADGNVFAWNPETDELTDFSGMTGLLKVR
jgi:chromosome segregation ATPase